MIYYSGRWLIKQTGSIEKRGVALPLTGDSEKGALVIGSSVEINIERADYRFTAV